LENNQKPKVNPSKGVIYIIQTADDKTLYKVGRTKNLKNRLLSYNSDKKDDIIPLYIYETDDIEAVEKFLLKNINIENIKKFIKLILI